LQNFIILQTKLNPQTTNLLPDAYVYAWYIDLYLFLDDGEWHMNVKDYFGIKETKTDIIWNFLLEEWKVKKYHTFYELEKHLNVEYEQNEIKRSDLIHILRYAYLIKYFNEEFWKKLLEPMQHPSEASIITSKFNTSDLYFI